MSREVEEARHVVVRDFRQPGNDYRVEVECRCGWKGFETSFPLHKATAVQAALAELFARRARFGWDYWGDESLGTAQMPEAK